MNKRALTAIEIEAFALSSSTAPGRWQLRRTAAIHRATSLEGIFPGIRGSSREKLHFPALRPRPWPTLCRASNRLAPKSLLTLAGKAIPACRERESAMGDDGRDRALFAEWHWKRRGRSADRGIGRSEFLPTSSSALNDKLAAALPPCVEDHGVDNDTINGGCLAAQQILGTGFEFPALPPKACVPLGE
jgi:hypothetical protein